MNEQVYQIGDFVLATPKNGDFNNEFSGTVVGFKDQYIQVRDMEDNVFDCEADQIEHL